LLMMMMSRWDDAVTMCFVFCLRGIPAFVCDLCVDKEYKIYVVWCYELLFVVMNDDDDDRTLYFW